MNKLITTSLIALSLSAPLHAETLPPLKDGLSPETIDAAWGDYDPRLEPLEVEVHKEWKEEGTVIRAVRYRIGIFKGVKAWMAGLYAFPEGGENLPAIVQIHGGGGRASQTACIDNAKRGYATLSVSWRADERYLEDHDLPEAAQTDWGAVEGRQVSESRGIEPTDEKRFDPVPSARNSGYFLRTLAMRRGLTFLEEQAEVDGEKLGLDGFSMGGVITMQTAAMDDRVKAAAPAWAPPVLDDGTLEARTGTPAAYAEKIKCPVFWMSPSNDFHGMVEDVQWVIDRVPSEHVRISRSTHYNHADDSQSKASRELWFDSLLKGNFSYPEQPQIQVDLTGKDGKPMVTVTADESSQISHVDVYYTRDAQFNDNATNRTRLWHYAPATKGEKTYEAELDLFHLDEPLWVYANVQYTLEDAGKKHALTEPAETFTVTTQMPMFTAETLQNAQVKTKAETTNVIESFDQGWEKDWVKSKTSLLTWKLNDPRIPMPEYGKLVIKLTSEKESKLKVGFGKTFNGEFPLQGGEAETIEVYPFDLVDKETGAKLLSWKGVTRPSLSIGTVQGVPEFHEVSWQPIEKAEFIDKRPFQLGAAEKTDGKVMLSFLLADRVKGRFDPEGKNFKVADSNKGVDIKNGLHVHSQDVSEVTYYLKGEFQTFGAKLIPCFQASVVFEVHADGKKVFQSEVIKGQTPPQDIKVDITGAQELKLVVTEGGNGWSGDAVLWGSAYCE